MSAVSAGGAQSAESASFGWLSIVRMGLVQTALGALGMPGQTAHVGMIATGRVAAGERTNGFRMRCKAGVYQV